MPDTQWSREQARILNIPGRDFVSQSADPLHIIRHVGLFRPRPWPL